MEGCVLDGRIKVCRRQLLRRPQEDGAVAVEFALVLPLLAMLLLGTITAGLAYTHSLGLTNAVREGARFAATAPYPPLDPSADWDADVIQRTRDVQFDDPLGETRICVDLFKAGTGSLVDRQCEGDASLGTPSAFSAPSGTEAGRCVVRIWAARYFTINAVLLQFPDRIMTRQSIAVYEREPCGT